MKIDKNVVVRFNYVLKDEQGNAVESSENSGPMAYLHGAGNIVPGLESALTGKTEGDRVEVKVPPEEAYGQHNEQLIQRVPLKRLKGAGKISKGDVLRIRTSQGAQMARVVKVGRFHADLDANHPLAGRTLHFEVEITEVREATPEEVQHGHAHGEGGHDHDHG